MKFSQKTKEELRHYVYVLIDSRDNRIFYVGKGQGNRVFEHKKDALQMSSESDKLDTIREIISSNEEVRSYIVRHGLEENEALIVESVLIDFLTFKDFSEVAKITNIVAGHHSFDRGIKTVNDIETLYNCKPLLERDIKHKCLVINVNKTYNQKNVKDNIYQRPNIYEATYQLSRPNKVGAIMALIRECQPKTIEEWESWYFENAQTAGKNPFKITKESSEELGKRLYKRITEIKNRN
ncbi:MAG: MjaI family restriction endonuclease [Dysgonamonadaceae bacterium]|jgi:hypothetical protein|nr:MjaI family restriction endonuclease [Dysgonamonadaceae bacterium]